MISLYRAPAGMQAKSTRSRLPLETKSDRARLRAGACKLIKYIAARYMTVERAGGRAIYL